MCAVPEKSGRKRATAKGRRRSGEPLPALTAEQVRATLERIRRDRDERDRRGWVTQDR
jgi:hypothetical protein